ncbi:alpha-L-fucosidase [Helcococcus kunzii]|uniref:alpha-L-fucosidase n=1 Tax=Helcococcus kunzii TaxID=40091 RepID=UPI0021A5C8E9|nr:alpha-L-fucosidase [Helcococcus kunzii]MCT1795369.1 alpha-L-fucosidase [Helcococcus kunzii]MCT1989550.1 alpha-L-fucosidase [Helcococcus kunzii]
MREYKGPVPNNAQIKYHEEEMSAFMHFGMNTFTEVEWGNGKEKLEDFKLKHFDFDGYVKFIKEMGFKRLIFTAKHHDGFCMFDSKYTDHKITNTSYGKDFFAELSEACTKYDLDMGCYLSPWDVHENTYGTGEAYNRYYLNQLEEICNNPKYGNNGKFVEWWFDNAKDPRYKDQVYDFDLWIDAVKKNNPEMLLFGVGSRGGVHWLGNEMGYAPEENAPRLQKKEDMTIDYSTEFKSRDGHNENYVWSVPEADTCTTSGWFSHPEEKLKSVEELKNIYLKSVGRGAVLLLNIAPNKEGGIRQELKDNIIEFKNTINREFSNKLNEKFKITNTENNEGRTIIINIEDIKEQKINYIVLQEDIKYGSRFKEGYIFVNEERINIPSIGAKRIIKIDNNQYSEKAIYNIRIELNGESRLILKEISIY